jgi:hypothetical protein
MKSKILFFIISGMCILKLQKKGRSKKNGYNRKIDF